MIEENWLWAVFTIAAALAQTLAGGPPHAWPLMERALAAGTPDARLHLHAGLVAAAAGRADAARWLRAAAAQRALLLPSERRALARALDS